MCFVTATQPLLDKIEPKSRALSITTEQQMIPNTRQLFDDLKRVEVKDKTKVGGWSNDEIRELAGQKVVESGSVLVVVNTKTSAREIYQQCKQINNVETYHLSTHMCPAHRLDVLNQVKKCLDPKTRSRLFVSVLSLLRLVLIFLLVRSFAFWLGLIQSRRPLAGVIGIVNDQHPAKY